ncbi:hypothetical protein BDA96_02G443100 [Sorghum bicolor]|uniref:Uncharacterized protein n=2 Tax=Sorghum bicolor TaxID=4558 RepID=A0A921UWT4_SORBI|nr:hypothetical protein BDA96_02G443100 [Sorghum bicolor]KXG36985.1 hypothetical protein SORBI_3002G422900 [Sorghum bicolor]
MKAEILSAEIARRKARVREAPNPEHTTKLQQSEAKNDKAQGCVRKGSSS